MKSTDYETRLAVPALCTIIALLNLTGCNRPADTQPPVETQAVAIPAIQAAQTLPATTPIQPSRSDIVVEVDGETLTSAELNDQVKRVLALERRQFPNREAFMSHLQILRNRIVQLFVRRALLSNETKRRNITASDEEIAEEIAKIKEQIPEGQTLEMAMKAQGITEEEFQKDIRDGLARQKLLDLLTSHIAKATDEDIKKFYDDNQELFAVPEHVVVRHILVGCETNATPQVRKEKKKAAEGYRKQLLKGTDFTQLARKHSDDPEAKRSGGLLGPFTREARIVPQFLKASFEQKVDKIGPVLATDMGYHIIQVLEHNEDSTTPLEEAKAGIARKLDGERQAPVIAELLEQLRDKAKISVHEGQPAAPGLQSR